ncbi:MAG TPA: hypothetical protein VGR26_12345 [Acidimicrobiales bacterium]|nr:hypothetical protein [Acidimicrobiales bacterium]
MLYGRRNRLQQIAQAEADGKNLWTTEFDRRTRARIAAVFSQVGSGAVAIMDQKVVGLLMREEGLFIDKSFLNGLMKADDEQLPSLIEAILIALRAITGSGRSSSRLPVDASSVERDINEVLNEHRISYELVNGQMVAFQSKELHQEVVEPTLRLLPGRRGWDKVEAAYQAALREISSGNPADAITDAGTALQEALMLLGCQGNALGSLIKSAKSKGLLAPHDSQLTDGIEKIAHWVSADRSESGDSHKASTGVTRDDAWFTVHVVGALIVRLAGGPRSP